MGNLDDGPDQRPLAATKVQEAILALLPGRRYDLLLTHAPRRRIHPAPAARGSLPGGPGLMAEGDLRARNLWQFAYEDGGDAYPPRPREDADLQLPLSDAVWTQKYSIITEVYGFGEASWEARAVPRREAFSCFRGPEYSMDGWGRSDTELMKILVLYNYPPAPGGLAPRGTSSTRGSWTSVWTPTRPTSDRISRRSGTTAGSSRTSWWASASGATCPISCSIPSASGCGPCRGWWRTATSPTTGRS